MTVKTQYLKQIWSLFIDLKNCGLISKLALIVKVLRKEQVLDNTTVKWCLLENH